MIATKMIGNERNRCEHNANKQSCRCMALDTVYTYGATLTHTYISKSKQPLEHTICTNAAQWHSTEAKKCQFFFVLPFAYFLWHRLYSQFTFLTRIWLYFRLQSDLVQLLVMLARFYSLNPEPFDAVFCLVLFSFCSLGGGGNVGDDANADTN